MGTTAAPQIIDEIGGPSTKELAGTRLLYEYTTGRKYLLEFGADTLTFQFMKDPNAKKMPMPYRARKIRENLYMVHWIVKANAIHVTLVIDLESDHVHVSAMMPGGIEFFDIAKIEMKEDHRRA